MRLATNKLPDGTKKVFIAHREVAKAFIPNPDGLPEVNHITGLKRIIGWRILNGLRGATTLSTRSTLA